MTYQEKIDRIREITNEIAEHKSALMKLDVELTSLIMEEDRRRRSRKRTAKPEVQDQTPLV